MVHVGKDILQISCTELDDCMTHFVEEAVQKKRKEPYQCHLWDNVVFTYPAECIQSFILQLSKPLGAGVMGAYHQRYIKGDTYAQVTPTHR